MLLAVILSLAISAGTTPLYRSEATFIIAPNKNLPSSRDVVSAFTALDTLDIFSTYADILSSDRVYLEAQKNLEVEQAVLAQYRRVTRMNPESIILSLTVDGPDAQIASQLANELGSYGIQFINAYFTVFEIDFLDQAVPAVEPFQPRTYRSALIFAGAGLLIGMLVVIIKEFSEIPLSQFVQRFSIDAESLAYTRRSVERSLVALKSTDKDWPISFLLVRLKNLEEFLSVAPGFSRKKVATEIVKRLRSQLKGNDIIGRWDGTTFSIALPRTPQKTLGIIETRIKGVFDAPFAYGVEESEQIMLETLIASSTAKDEGEFEIFVEKAQKELEDIAW
jgi:capsular polysaccharide biosynthesis protein